MATNEELRERLRNLGIELRDEPVNYTLDDVARWSIERSLADRGDSVVRVVESRGLLRFSGQSVDGNRVRISALATAVSSWQRLVTVVGASINGNKSARGRLATDIIERTTLQVDAAPAPGSVILNLVPERHGFDDVYPDGEPLFTYDGRALADLAVEHSIELLGAVKGVVQDRLSDMLLADGTRVATAMKALLTAISDETVDADFGWTEPGRPQLNVAVTEAEARSGLLAIKNRRLDAEPITLTGELRTVSLDRRLELATRLDDQDVTLQILRGQVSPERINSLHTGTTVTVNTLMTQEIGPGGQITETFEALSIEPA